MQSMFSRVLGPDQSGNIRDQPARQPSAAMPADG